MMHRIALLSLRMSWLVSVIAPAQAWAQAPQVDDRDLSPPPALRMKGDIPLKLSPDRKTTAETPGSLSIRILRDAQGKALPVTNLAVVLSLSGAGNPPLKATTDQEGLVRFSPPASCGADQGAKLEARLARGKLFSVTNGSESYRLATEVPCQGATTLHYTADSSGGQALGIWQIGIKAEEKLAQSVGLSFWSRTINFSWPAGGDYYNWDTVSLTRGDHWDVVGHELGHAIYDQARLGAFGGGQHWIDRCHSTALALSEGWASYFSAWLSVDLADADAKFEHLVPRRAPIRFENIPSDVCWGEDNEWRVTGFFWDLIDFNNDGEHGSEPFARIWNAMKGSRAGSASEVREKLLQQGFDAELMKLIWELNFGK